MYHVCILLSSGKGIPCREKPLQRSLSILYIKYKVCPVRAARREKYRMEDTRNHLPVRE